MDWLTKKFYYLSMIEIILNPIVKLLLLYVMILVIRSLKKYLSQ